MAYSTCIIFILCLFATRVTGFHPSATSSYLAQRWRYSSNYNVPTGPLLAAQISIPTAPDTEKARLVVQLTGPSVSSALFRAELKKELCFFRGCRAYFDPSDAQSNLICEGQTKQIKRFIEWLNALSTDVSERKANFQGPSLVAYITALSWEPAKGDLAAGFSCSTDVPTLEGVIKSSSDSDGKKMMGSDESV